MVAFIIQNMAPIMFGSLVIFLLLGYPAAFSLGAVGLLFALLGIELGLFVPDFLQALPDRIYGVMGNDTLLAIPFFTFMGLVLERSGMAEDLLDTIGQLFGTVRGGLAYAVIFVGALLAATTGVVAASVISMGLISLPIMLRYGYDRRVASGVIAASGTLAQIIPPSLVLIVMADQLGKSVGDMYEGAFIPGLLLAGLYAFYVFLVSVAFPKATPGLPKEAVGFREADGSRGDSLACCRLRAEFSPGLYGQTGRHGADFVVLSMFLAFLRLPCGRSLLVVPASPAFGCFRTWRSRPPSSWCRRCPDFSRARHDLHRRRHADRRRRHGRKRRLDPWRRQAPADLGPGPPGRRIDGQAFVPLWFSS